jgi:catabolite regulation protein CreA
MSAISSLSAAPAAVLADPLLLAVRIDGPDPSLPKVFGLTCFCASAKTAEALRRIQTAAPMSGATASGNCHTRVL